MQEIEVGPEVMLLDDEDVILLVSRPTFNRQNGYAYLHPTGSNPYTVHSVVMGGTREGWNIDHINGNKLDNRKCNLRWATYRENQINRKRLNKNNSSGARGVGRKKHSKKWQASITVNRRLLHLGYFTEFEDAVAARKAAELKYWGVLAP